jgi:hypothetical protein
MTGLSSFLLELAFPAFLAIMVIAAVVEAVRTRRAGNAVVVILLAGFAALIGSRFYHQGASRRFLQTLRAGDVAQVRVGNRSISQPEQVAAVVEALNHSEQYSANHGGWGRSQWLVVELKSGQQRAFTVAKYEREKGAIVGFSRSSPFGRWHDGYALSRTLAETLEGMGVRFQSDRR